MSDPSAQPILQTYTVQEGDIYHFNQDEEIIQFLEEHPYLGKLYEEIMKAENIAVVVPLVALMDDERQEFDLQIIVRHENPSDFGQWDMYFAVDFVNNQTNLNDLFQTIKIATECDLDQITESIVTQLDDIYTDIAPDAEPFVDIKEDFLAFGVNKYS